MESREVRDQLRSTQVRHMLSCIQVQAEGEVRLYRDGEDLYKGTGKGRGRQALKSLRTL